MSIGLCLRQLRQMRLEGGLRLPEASALKRLDRSGPTSVTELAQAEQILSLIHILNFRVFVGDSLP